MRDNDMVTEAQFGQVKVRIDAWRSTVQPTHTTLYIIIAVVVLLLLLLIYRRTKKSPKMPVT